MFVFIDEHPRSKTIMGSGIGKLCEAQVSFFLNLSSSAFAMFVLRSLYLDLWRRKQSEGGFDKPEGWIHRFVVLKYVDLSYGRGVA